MSCHILLPCFSTCDVPLSCGGRCATSLSAWWLAASSGSSSASWAPSIVREGKGRKGAGGKGEWGSAETILLHYTAAMLKLLQRAAHLLVCAATCRIAPESNSPDTAWWCWHRLRGAVGSGAFPCPNTEAMWSAVYSTQQLRTSSLPIQSLPSLSNLLSLPYLVAPHLHCQCCWRCLAACFRTCSTTPARSARCGALHGTKGSGLTLWWVARGLSCLHE